MIHVGHLINGKIKVMKTEVHHPMNQEEDGEGGDLYPMWLIDTGASDIVADHGCVGKAPIVAEQRPMQVTTAQGVTFITQSAQAKFRNLCEYVVKVYLLAQCPPALASCKLCYDFGCSTIWIGKTYDFLIITQKGGVIYATMINGCPYIEDVNHLCKSLAKSIQAEHEPLLDVIKSLQKLGPFVHRPPSMAMNVQMKTIQHCLSSKNESRPPFVQVYTKDATGIISEDPSGRAPSREECSSIITMDSECREVVWVVDSIGALTHMCDDPNQCRMCLDKLMPKLAEPCDTNTFFFY